MKTPLPLLLLENGLNCYEVTKLWRLIRWAFTQLSCQCPGLSNPGLAGQPSPERCQDVSLSSLLAPLSPGCGPCLQSPAGRVGKEGQRTQKAFSYKSINLYSHPNGLGTSNTATLSCKEGWEMEPLFWYPIQHRGSMTIEKEVQVSSVQSLSRVWLSATPWTAAHQASLSITNSWSPPKPMSIESVRPSNHLILLSAPSPPALNLPQHQGLFKWVSSSHQVAKVPGVSASTSSYQCYWVGIKVTALILYIKTFCPTWKCTVFLLI